MFGVGTRASQESGTSVSQNKHRLPALRIKNRSKQINEVDPSNPQVAEIKARARVRQRTTLRCLSRRESAGGRGVQRASEPNQRLSPQQAGF